MLHSCVPRGTTPIGHGASAMSWFRMNDGTVREIVEPISQPPGFRARRQFVRNVRGLDVLGSMCSRTSKRVTMSYWGAVVVAVVAVVDSDVGGWGWVWVDASTSSNVVFKYLNFPLRKCASTVGSMRA